MSENGHSMTGYILHHLTNLKVGEGFWSLHLDTMFFSIALGGVFLWMFIKAARNATSGVPGGLRTSARLWWSS